MKTESACGLDGLDEQIVLAERRRQRVFRGWVLGALGCVLALVGLRLGWGLYAGRQLAGEIERIRAAGEPILLRDFDPAREILEAENAAIMYWAAAAAIVEPEGRSILLVDLYNSSADRIQYPDEIRVVVAENAEAMRLFREARGLSAVDWGVRFTSPIFGGSLGFAVGGLWELLGIGEFAAIASHREGNDWNAIETLRDMNAWANAQIQPMTTDAATIRSSLLANERLAGAIESIAPELIVVDERPNSGQSRKAASRTQVENLIDDLLDETQIRSAWRKAVFVHRAGLLDQRYADARKRVAEGGTSALLYAITAPAWDAQLLHVLAATEKQAAAGWAGNLSRARDFLQVRESLPYGATELRFLSQPLFFFGIPYSHWIRFRVLGLRRMAAIALSIRLFELDNNRRPLELSELVPRYLEALPYDPFAAEGQLFRYEPSGVVPMLYSFGTNEKDDGGKIAIHDDGTFNLYGMDMPYFLDGRPDDETLAAISARPKSPQAQNKNGD